MSKNPKSSRRRPAKSTTVKAKKQGAAALPLRPTLLPAPRLIADKAAWVRILRDIAEQSGRRRSESVQGILTERAGSVVIEAVRAGYLEGIPGLVESVARNTRETPNPGVGVEFEDPNPENVMCDVVGGVIPEDIVKHEQQLGDKGGIVPVEDACRGLLSRAGFTTEAIKDSSERLAFVCARLANLLENEITQKPITKPPQDPEEITTLRRFVEGKVEMDSVKRDSGAFKKTSVFKNIEPARRSGKQGGSANLYKRRDLDRAWNIWHPTTQQSNES